MASADGVAVRAWRCWPASPCWAGRRQPRPIDQPFGNLIRALADPQQWCAMLLLHINNKGCAASSIGAAPLILLKVARRHDQPPAAQLVRRHRSLSAQAARDRLRDLS
jgi:hypothetical protein